MGIRIQLLTLFVLNVFLANAQKNEVLNVSLQHAVEIAKKNNYTLQNSRIDQKISEKKVDEIFSYGLPQVNGAVGFTNNINVPTQSLPNFLKSSFLGSAYGQAYAAAKQQGQTDAAATTAGMNAQNIVNQQVPDYLSAQFGAAYTLQASATVSQLIFDGTFFLGVKAAKEFVGLSKLNVKRTEIETEVGVSKAYCAVLITNESKILIDKNIETLLKSFNDLNASYKNGLVEKIDVDRISVQLTNLQIQKGAVDAQYEYLFRILKLQMGLAQSDSITLSDNLEKINSVSTQNFNMSEKIDASKRVESQMNEQAFKLNEFDKKRYQMGYLPSMYLSLTELGNTFAIKDHMSDLGSSWYQGTILSINLSVPIFDGFRKSAQIQQAKLNSLKIQNDKKSLESGIEAQVLQNRANYLRAKNTVEARKTNMQLAEDIYNRANIKYKNGVGSSLELLTSQKELVEARNGYLSGMYDLFISEIDLKQSLGDIK